ncbi:hypothetical protein M8C17_01275 [Micromonospora sp. RHAY321]|uniref:hypothetical protein n=1 Tax=Micromonospora sp. RHAY321 TaxID=2944807 RepID=UPI00207CB155|nr:hypothetical protein [Micromonospora sp. RHAY321]MCO1593791.1 hypothetical protein [Micromonospora sp. RHAY321]
MSIDLEASLPRPVPLAAVLTAARNTLTELLGVDATPGLSVVVDRRYEQGRRIAVGRRLGGSELLSTTIGDPIDPESNGSPGAIHYEIDITGCNDGVWLMVMDHAPEGGSEVEAVFSPYRTCVSVVVATAMALAVADLGGGEFIDDQIQMLRPGHTDPRHVVKVTRLPRDQGEFPARCERYLRQFPHLGDWPRDVSMPLADAYKIV